MSVVETASPQLARSRATSKRNLILLRAGDASLHESWFGSVDTPRNWDLHISYYGKAGAPAGAGREGVTWSADDNPSKWSGISQAIKRGVIALDDYDYIALPDDDLVVDANGWSKAFDLARHYNLAACQLSLLPDSFFGWQDTVHRPLLKIRFVTAIELMAPVIRMDIFKQMIPFLELEDNLWGMDHIVANLVQDQPGSMAVLDAVTVLHTRAFWSGPLYDPLKASGRSLHDIENAFLARHDVARSNHSLLWAVTLWGQKVDKIWWAGWMVVLARLLRRRRNKTGLLRIAHAEGGKVYLSRRFWGAPKLAVDADKALLRRKPVA